MPHINDEMDHPYIDDEQLVERYRTGRLGPEESARFEEHFLGCSLCQEQLEAAEDFRRSLADLASDAVAIEAPRPGGLSRRLALLPPRPLLALAAALLVAVSAAALLLLGQLGRARSDLESARRAAADSRRDAYETREALERVQRMREKPDARVAALPAAAVGAAVFTLNLTRGAGDGTPENSIVLPGSPEWLVLLVDRPGPKAIRTFRARISTADGRPVGDVLTPSRASGDQLAVALPSSLLAPGDFALTIEGLATGGRAEPLATYSFRAARKP